MGQRIAELRRQEGRRRRVRLTQRQLADELGVHKGTVAAWEGDTQKPEGENLIKLAEALSTSPDHILGVAGLSIARKRTNGTSAEPRWPEPEPTDPEDVKAYLTFFGAEADAFRRMSRRLPLSDLAKGCLDDAREENMPDEHFAILYDRLAHLL